jgi:hypothetical protein
MQDAEDQPGQPAAFPVSPLAQHLLRRVREPLGIIDTQHAGQFHARTTGWIGRRLELLDILKSRYKPDPGAAATPSPGIGSMPYVRAFQTADAAGSPPVSSTPPSVMRSVWTASAAPDVEPSHQLRVKRRGAIPSANYSPVSPVEPASRESGAATAHNSLLPLGGSEIRVQRSPEPFMQHEAEAPELRRGGAGRSVVEPAPLTPPAAPGVVAPVAEFANAPRGSFSAVPGPQPVVTELPRPGNVAPQMRLRRKIDGAAMPSAAGAEGWATREPGSSPISQAVARVAELRTGAGSPPEVRLLRKYSHAEEPDESKSRPAADIGAGTPPANGTARMGEAVSPEIRTPPPQPGSTIMVWRKQAASGAVQRSGEAPQSATPVMNPPHLHGVQLMRATQGIDVSAAPVTEPRSGNGGLDVTQVAEQVSRILGRQLAVERERRGKTR